MNANEFTSLVNMQERACRDHADLPTTGTKRNGTYGWTTCAELGQRVAAFRPGFSQMGGERGNKVAIISNHRAEWAVAASATDDLGAHFVPIYEAQRPDEWASILSDSGAAVLVVASEELYAEVVGFLTSVESLRHIVCSERNSAADSCASWLTRGEALLIDSIELQTNEVAGLIDSSGTTGKSKGPLLSHRNTVSNINAVTATFPRKDMVFELRGKRAFRSGDMDRMDEEGFTLNMSAKRRNVALRYEPELARLYEASAA